MNKQEFIKIIRTFADAADAVEEEKGLVVFRAREQDYELQLRRTDGGIRCEEQGELFLAEDWICNRLGRLTALAQRIEDYIEDDPVRVPITGELTDFEESPIATTMAPTASAQEQLQHILESRSAHFCTSVLYLTSDAGEGKTRLLEALCRRQAQRYRAGDTNWLLLPVTLGGRGLLRLDDVIVGSLGNRFRFPFLYFDSVVELVKLGRLVLALDGFEEMFVENPDGEAVSSLGNLVRRLDSAGQIVVAARRAFFAYQDLSAMSRIFTSLGDRDVEFADLRLQRWTKDQFLSLARAMGVEGGEVIWKTLSDALGDQHPVLTRAVLARRLVEQCREADWRRPLLTRLAAAEGERYFEEFIAALVEREAKEKWVTWVTEDTETLAPLLSVEQHHELLALIAEEMWRGRTDALRDSVLQTVAELLAVEVFQKQPHAVNQIKERISHHALLVKVAGMGGHYRFDHETFKHYYLGRRVAEMLMREESLTELRDTLRHGMLPEQTMRTAIMLCSKDDRTRRVLAERLNRVVANDATVSFARSNGGGLAIGLLSGTTGEELQIQGLHFPQNSLQGQELHKVHFQDCTFALTTLNDSSLNNVAFERCSLDRLEFATKTRTIDVSVDVLSLPRVVAFASDMEELAAVERFAPGQVKNFLVGQGWRVEGTNASEAKHAQPVPHDGDLTLALRALRLYARSTGVNENTFRTRLGARGAEFFDRVMPALESAGVLAKTVYKGAGSQARYRLVVELSNIQKAKEKCDGTLADWLSKL